MRTILKYKLRFLSKLILAKYKPYIIVVTGSVGKTSTKEAIFKVINYQFPGSVRKSEKNLNTEIGLPLTIIGGFNAGRNLFLWSINILKAIGLIVTRRNYPTFLVLELAADRPGDIGWLTSFIKPDISVVTAIGDMPVHLEFFSSLQEYTQEKAKVITALRKGGVAVLNFNDPLVKSLNAKNIISYGKSEEVDVRIKSFNYKIPSDYQDVESAGMTTEISYKGEDISVFTPGTLGEGVVGAVIAAFAVGVSMKFKPKNVAKGLSQFIPPEGRMNVIRGIKGTIIIDDTYNASPLSFSMALKTLEKFRDKRKIAVIGDMRELGENNESAHRQIGEYTARVADAVFLVGDSMVIAKEELEKKGFLESKNLWWFETSDEAKKVIKGIIRPDDVILIKGSRAVKMDLILNQIKE